MEQQKIWEYYQNDNLSSFDSAEGRLRFLVRQIHDKESKNIKVLNIGVGNGLFEKMSKDRGIDIYCLDPDDRTISKLSKKLDINGKAKVGYSQNIPFSDNLFDFVVVSEVFEHLSEEVLDRSLIEIHRILKQRGALLGTVPARENLQENIVVCPSCGQVFHRWGHVQSFTEQRIVDLLGQNFNIQKVTEKYFITWSTLNWKGKISSFLKLILHIFGIRGSGNSIFFNVTKQ